MASLEAKNMAMGTARKAVVVTPPTQSDNTLPFFPAWAGNVGDLHYLNNAVVIFLPKHDPIMRYSFSLP